MWTRAAELLNGPCDVVFSAAFILIVVTLSMLYVKDIIRVYVLFT